MKKTSASYDKNKRKEYLSRPEIILRMRGFRKKYRSKPENIKKIRKQQKEYYSRPEVKLMRKESAKAYRKKATENNRRYYLKNKLKAKRYNSKPEVKLRMRKFLREYHSRPEVKSRIRERNSKPEAKLLRKKFFREYRKTPRGRLILKAGTHRRMANLKFKIGNIKAEQVKQIFERDKICVYNTPNCLVNKDLQLDHIVPISNENGNSVFYNYVVACSLCNISKGNKNVFTWCKEKEIQVPEIVLNNLNKLFEEMRTQKTLSSPLPSKFSPESSIIYESETIKSYPT